MQPERWEGKGKWIALILVGVVVIGLGIYFFLGGKSAKESSPIAEPPEKDATALIPKPSSEPAKEPLTAARVALPDSDDWVRKKTRELSPDTGWNAWLMHKNLIRRLTAAVVNISEGKSPRKHLSFLGSQKPFSALKKDGKFLVDHQSYNRYNLVADVFSSVDAAKAVELFKEFKPFFQEAYRELGYPQGEFQEVLTHALKELLAVPVVEGEVHIKEAILSYWIVDDMLEDLSEAQKNLLRMGPQNTRKIQKKLREMGVLLGVAENQLPKSKVIAAKNE